MWRRTIRVAGQDLGADPEALIAAFLREYRDDEEMRSVDAFVCSHPAAMCEVFEGLNQSLLVYATTRYEMARCFSDAARQGEIGNIPRSSPPQLDEIYQRVRLVHFVVTKLTTLALRLRS